MRFDLRKIPLDFIDLENTKYKVSTHRPIDDIMLSIQRIGLLSPPIIQGVDKGYIVVSGFRRIAASKQLGWFEIDARVITNEANNRDCLKVAIADNALNRQLNLIEQSMSLSKLSVFYKDDKELCQIAETIGLNVNQQSIKKLLSLSTFIPELKHCIQLGIIPLTIALELGKIDNSSAIAIVNLFDTLKPTLNQQKEFLTMLTEISSIRNIFIYLLLGEKTITDILIHSQLNRNEKIVQLRSILKSMRFPTITMFYDNFNDMIHRLKLPNSIKIIPPDNFEDIYYSVTLKFHSLSEFISHLNILKNISDLPELKTIVSKDIADK